MAYFNISKDELCRSIQWRGNETKLIAIDLLRLLVNLKHKEISKIFTNIKLTSVSALIKRCKKWIKLNFLFGERVVTLTQLIQMSHVGT